MEQIFALYNKLRGKNVKESEIPFWDVVVITAGDDEQRAAFQVQLESKLNNLELPMGVPYYVVADPPGPKIGGGGSTLVVMSFLYEKYSDNLFNLKILLLHAGGQSQRLPTQSVLGKLFSPLPLGKPMYQMLDLSLAIYMPFVKNMDPGVFLACSDVILTYDLNKTDELPLRGSGFVALAHPSPINIGTKHGVYILPSYQNPDDNQTYFITSCLKVLQKPTTEEMRSEKAVFLKQSPGGELEEWVYSDSAFYFSRHVIRKLLHLYESINPVSCEIDAYGDFLQPLGMQSNLSFLYNTRNVVSTSESLWNVRKMIYNTLKDVPLDVLVLTRSKFHHTGTMMEYVDNFCKNQQLIRDIGISSFAFSVTLKPASKLSQESFLGATKIVVMHSMIHPSSVIGKKSVIEYCEFASPVTTQGTCIISNCSLSGPISDVFIIPSGLFHTIPIKKGDWKGYVTIAFHFHDDLKKKLDIVDCGNLQYFGTKFEKVVTETLGFSSVGECFSNAANQGSLWTAKMFQLFPSMEVSFINTVSMVNSIKSGKKHSWGDSFIGIWMSMAGILKNKDVERMVQYRNNLKAKIQEHLNTDHESSKL